MQHTPTEKVTVIWDESLTIIYMYSSFNGECCKKSPFLWGYNIERLMIIRVTGCWVCLCSLKTFASVTRLSFPYSAAAECRIYFFIDFICKTNIKRGTRCSRGIFSAQTRAINPSTFHQRIIYNYFYIYVDLYVIYRQKERTQLGCIDVRERDWWWWWQLGGDWCEYLISGRDMN